MYISFLYVYVCIYICYIYMYVCMYVYIYMYVCMYVYIYGQEVKASHLQALNLLALVSSVVSRRLRGLSFALLTKLKQVN